MAHANSAATFQASLAAAVLLGCALAGCQSLRSSPENGHLDGDAGREVAPPPLETVLDLRQALPARSTVIAVADRLTHDAEHRDPRAAAELMHAAAQLYARLWRVEHRESDARASTKLAQIAAERASRAALPLVACEAGRLRAQLIGDETGDPRVLYAELYKASQLWNAEACRALWLRTLTPLSAFGPSPGDRQQLDAEVARLRRAADDRTNSAARREGGPRTPADMLTTPPVQGDAAGGSGSASNDARGVVVTPDLAPGGVHASIVSIEPYGSEDRARIVVTLSAPASYRVGDGPGPSLFVDLPDVEGRGPDDERAVGGLVRRVRSAQGALPGTTRLTVELSNAALRRVFYLPEPFRIVIDLATEGAAVARAPRGAPRTVNRVALDAGHGGIDPGATGPRGLREKDVTLDIVHRAAPVLSRELGVLTMLTRDDDRAVPLDARAARANAFHADLFVSVHCNSSENGDARGVMSFVLDATHDKAAAGVAARENAISLSASSQVASVAAGLRVSDVAAHSAQFAELVQRAAVASLSPRYRVPDHGVKSAGFFVLVGAEMPSVLFETSFISNTTDERRLATPEYRAKLADAIVNAVRAYREGR